MSNSPPSGSRPIGFTVTGTTPSIRSADDRSSTYCLTSPNLTNCLVSAGRGRSGDGSSLEILGANGGTRRRGRARNPRRAAERGAAREPRLAGSPQAADLAGLRTGPRKGFPNVAFGCLPYFRTPSEISNLRVNDFIVPTLFLASLRQQRLACRPELPRTGFMSPSMKRPAVSSPRGLIDEFFASSCPCSVSLEGGLRSREVRHPSIRAH